MQRVAETSIRRNNIDLLGFPFIEQKKTITTTTTTTTTRREI
jgi:hypothetical protein